MAETTEKTGEKEKLSIAAPTKTLSLKPRSGETGVVRQSFSHGRTKAVVVEKVKSRGPAKAPAGAAPPAVAKSSAPGGKTGAASQTAAPASGTATSQTAATKPSGVVLRVLTAAEQNARAHALSDARLR